MKKKSSCSVLIRISLWRKDGNIWENKTLDQNVFVQTKQTTQISIDKMMSFENEIDVLF